MIPDKCENRVSSYVTKAYRMIAVVTTIDAVSVTGTALDAHGKSPATFHNTIGLTVSTRRDTLFIFLVTMPSTLLSKIIVPWIYSLFKYILCWGTYGQFGSALKDDIDPWTLKNCINKTSFFITSYTQKTISLDFCLSREKTCVLIISKWTPGFSLQRNYIRCSFARFAKIRKLLLGSVLHLFISAVDFIRINRNLL